MLNKIVDFTTEHKMLEKGDRIVVGVSGGADSVCLLHVLIKLCQNTGITLAVVHVNHGIRGEEAKRDEQFVKQLCEQSGIDFHPYSYDIQRLAQEEGLSEEEAGRKMRYRAFLEVCRLKQCNKIAVAHNKNDNAETFLFNLFRGSGIKGLSGMEPSRILPGESGNIMLIRPLLCVERKEIEEYLHEEKVGFQTDSTNLTDDYSRNKIRNRILSYAVKEINTQAIGNINEAASHLMEAWEYIDSQVMLRYPALVRESTGSYYITVRELIAEPQVLQKGIIRRIAERMTGNLNNLEAGHIAMVLSLCNKQVSRQVQLPQEIIAERGYEDIVMYCRKDKVPTNSEEKPMIAVMLAIPGRTEISQKRVIFETKVIKYEKCEPIPKSSCMKWFDYDKIENAVELRSRKEGDFIQINASGGCKKLKRYFIDRKISQKARESQLLIADGNHIMWIPGALDRISEKYKVDASTNNVLLMKMIVLEENKDDG